jgi:hypothetical protein
MRKFGALIVEEKATIRMNAHFVSSVDRVIDVFGQYQARYLFCCQHSQSVHGGAEESALGGSKTCA